MVFSCENPPFLSFACGFGRLGRIGLSRSLSTLPALPPARADFVPPPAPCPNESCAICFEQLGEQRGARRDSARGARVRPLARHRWAPFARVGARALDVSGHVDTLRLARVLLLPLSLAPREPLRGSWPAPSSSPFRTDVVTPKVCPHSGR